MPYFRGLLVLCISSCTLLLPAFGQTNFRWCAKGTKEFAKCVQFKNALTAGLAASAGVSITAACVDGMNAEGCMKKIKNGEADLITLDGGEIYTAGKKYEMVPVVAEDYGGNKGTYYYAVAVAKKNNSAVSLGNLKGKTSCHTGYQKTAGYNVPVGYLLSSKKMDRVACGEDGTAASVSKFFSESCIPGAPSAYKNLCARCPKDNCKKDKTNKYYDYTGAFMCMADGAGDVAFVKHLTTGEMVEKGGFGNMSDYDYLCTDNTRKAVTPTSHETCSLSIVRSHAVMTKSGSNIDVFKKVLLKASELCQGNMTATNCSGFQIFSSSGARDLLFKDSTTKLVDVGDKKTYKAWLGDEYIESVEGITDNCPTSGSPGVLAAFHTLVILAVGALLSYF